MRRLLASALALSALVALPAMAGEHHPGRHGPGPAHAPRVIVAPARHGVRPLHWDRRPHDFDRSVYRRVFHAPRHFHWGVYHRPPGWYYRRWMYGELFPRPFWAREFWIASWWLYDLPIPPEGYEWVRYGSDAVLVNTETGEILQVVYDIYD